ncbi:MAG: ribonuclease HII [Pseudomonadota bacterium]
MFFNKNYAGVDEVGRGCLAGPVTICALVLESDCLNDELTDSKKLSPARREELASQIKTISRYEIISFSSEEIDRYNILRATLMAMTEALNRLKPERAYIDGNKCPHSIVPCEAIIKGDNFVPAISAASILAKVTRDRHMVTLSQKYPAYGFEKHKGYGTQYHLKALAENGITPEHRLSFAPVRKVLSV